MCCLAAARDLRLAEVKQKGVPADLKVGCGGVAKMSDLFSDGRTRYTERAPRFPQPLEIREATELGEFGGKAKMSKTLNQGEASKTQGYPLAKRGQSHLKMQMLNDKHVAILK